MFWPCCSLFSFKALLYFRHLYYFHEIMFQGALNYSERFNYCVWSNNYPWSAFILLGALLFNEALLFFLQSAFLFLHSAFLMLHSASLKFFVESALVYFSNCESARYFIYSGTAIISILKCEALISWFVEWDFWWYYVYQ